MLPAAPQSVGAQHVMLLLTLNSYGAVKLNLYFSQLGALELVPPSNNAFATEFYHMVDQARYCTIAGLSLDTFN